MMAALLLGLNFEVVPMCFISDLRSLCCPAYCQARGDVRYFDRAERIFKECAKGACGKGRRHSRIVCSCGGKP
jgi:hypothetical protein